MTVRDSARVFADTTFQLRYTFSGLSVTTERSAGGDVLAPQPTGGWMCSSVSWLVGLLLASLLPLARADVGLNLYGLSWHLDGDKAREKGLDHPINPGLGLRFRMPGEKVDYFFDAGFYRDSGRNTAVLAAAAGHWRATESARLGLALAVLNSKTYNDGKAFVAPLPIAAWEFRSTTLNLVYMPKVHQVNDMNTLGFWLTVWLSP